MPNNSLRPIREKKGMTLAQLAGKTSISIRTLQMYETGERAISADDLRKLSRVLFAPTAELLQPSAEPPPPPTPLSPAPTATSESAIPPSPPMATVEPAIRPSPPKIETAPTGPPRESISPQPSPAAHPANGEVRADDRPHAPGDFNRRPFPPVSPGGHGEYRRPFGAAPAPRPVGGPRPVGPRAPRPPRAARPPGPSTKGQLEQISNLARRMGLSEAEVEERIGASLTSLDHLGARNAIAKLHQELEESGTWQPRVGEGADQEGAYLGKLRDRELGVVAQLINGQRVEGRIVDYTPYTIRLRGESGDEVTVRKLAIAYYQTRGPVDDPE